MLAALLLVASSFAGAQTFTLDPSTGSLRAQLSRDGPLAALGHDHEIVSSSFTGRIELSSASATLSMTVDARALRVDDPVPESDRAQIEKTMRGPKGLDVERFPTMSLASDSIEPVPEEQDVWHLIGRFSMHGSTQTIEAPVTMQTGPDGGRWFSGYVRLRQSDFGIKPYSAFAGAIRVRDDVVVSFSLLGRPERR